MCRVLDRDERIILYISPVYSYVGTLENDLSQFSDYSHFFEVNGFDFIDLREHVQLSIIQSPHTLTVNFIEMQRGIYSCLA